ncbi:helix-turn-helix transcriptional regulator [Amycolatopsis rhizosphaerae]|uniref:Helix-turn-helix transcriptional regulator n=1 Tax=Amycolatopsis rhizosphaerae TaxID=2053003 RepID=A0A558B425_9PSEU|nr:helix-turn-helix transcriptional regulator [Amycolatopsis rhizosphaerae]TVT31257.1 helix-turn-helix transcriptional regulator [Amycolatopsis rhizosphaerae]
MANKRIGLARARKAAGFTQERLAETLGVDTSTIARWESGQLEPSPYRRPKLARLLMISRERMEELLQEGTTTPVVGSAWPAPVARDDSRTADLVTVAALREQTLQVEAEYETAPSTQLLARATQHLARIMFLRAETSSKRIRRELWSVEAETATLMGQLIWDASQRRDHRSPRHYFEQAIAAARQVNDPVTEAYAILRKSYLALYGEKQPDAGLAAAREAATVAHPASPALTGLALLHVAEANAMLGERRACETALGDAREQLALISDADAAGDYFSPAEFDRMAGSCYLFLGLTRHAETPLGQAARGLATKKKSQAIVLGNLSLARLRHGEVDGAVEALHHAIDALELTWGGGGLNIAFTAGRELRPWRQQPAVQEAGERLFALMSGA